MADEEAKLFAKFSVRSLERELATAVEEEHKRVAVCARCPDGPLIVLSRLGCTSPVATVEEVSLLRLSCPPCRALCDFAIVLCVLPPA